MLSGSSRLWDAVAGGLSLLSVGGERPGVVKALVVLSDGRDVSSLKTRDEALKLALDWGIQVYAVGIGNVPQETELAEMVRASGGVYYSAPDLDSLQVQVRQLIDDLLGQYMVSYISLREAGSHSVRVEITAQGSTAALETDSLDFGSFYGQDIQGVVSIDPAAVDISGEKATAYVRAVHVPRDTTAFRFRHVTEALIQVSLEPEDSGGLLEGWVVTGPDALGFYDLSSATPLEFGSFGVLMKLSHPLVTGDATGTLLEFDNTIYQADKRFFYPPHSGDLASRLQSSTIKVLAAAAVVIEEEGKYDFLNSFYWWILALGSFVLFGAYLRIAVAGEGRLTLPLESLNGLGTIAVVVLAVLLEGWEGGVALVAGALVIGPPVAYIITIIARMRRYLVRPRVRMPLEAIAQYNESIRGDPQNADHYYDRGRLYLNIGHFQRAINDYDKAIRLNPRHAVAHYLRGQAYGQMGQERQAIEDFNEAIQLNPRLVDAYFARARAYTVLGLEEDASRDIDQAVVLGLDPIFLEEVIEDLRRERLVRERAAQRRRRR